MSTQAEGSNTKPVYAITEMSPRMTLIVNFMDKYLELNKELPQQKTIMPFKSIYEMFLFNPKFASGEIMNTIRENLSKLIEYNGDLEAKELDVIMIMDWLKKEKEARQKPTENGVKGTTNIPNCYIVHM